MNSIHIWPEEPWRQPGGTQVSAVLKMPAREQLALWYRIPENLHAKVPTNADHFVVGTIFLLMKMGMDVHVHGQVSPSLLRNLEEFQAAWVAVRPDLVHVCISADHEREEALPNQIDQAIMAFSGGVDSCFTAFRHTCAKNVRFPRKLTAAVMVHGFDIPLSDLEGFNLATERSRRMLSSLGIELLPVSTNYREIVGDWAHSHGAAVASCLHLFRGGFSEGLIGQTFTYGEIRSIMEGVNALTDPLLSSDNFKIIPDGAAFKRSDKILAISSRPELLKDLRVCWEGAQKDQNCCNCEKCMRNILTFRALGLGLPACFDRDISVDQIRTLRLGDRDRRRIRYEALLSLAKTHGTTGTWTDVLARRLAAQRRAEDSSLVRMYRRSRSRASNALASLWRKGN